MNRKRIGFIVLIVLVVLCFIIPLTYSKIDSGDKGIKITLIAKSATSNFWQTCFQGARAAAAEYNDLELKIVAPEVEWDYDAQNEFIADAMREGSDAIVFSACDQENCVGAVDMALDRGVPVITIDSGVNTSENITFIGMDNYEAGRQAAKSVIDNVGESGGVAVVSFEESSGNGAQRVEGFLGYMEDYPDIDILEVYYARSDYNVAQSTATKMMETYGDKLKAIATFNEITTVGVGRAAYATDDPDSICVVGFDNNMESIQMMESGYMDGLIVQNPFAMGYLGVQQAIAEIEGRAVLENVDTGTAIVTEDNMYTAEIEKLLFPFSN